MEFGLLFIFLGILDLDVNNVDGGMLLVEDSFEYEMVFLGCIMLLEYGVVNYFECDVMKVYFISFNVGVIIWVIVFVILLLFVFVCGGIFFCSWSFFIILLFIGVGVICLLVVVELVFDCLVNFIGILWSF